MRQELPTVYPLLHARNVMPYVLILGIVFIGIGVGLLIVSEKTKELVNTIFEIRLGLPS